MPANGFRRAGGRRFAGHGLGLAVVERIVRGLGGRSEFKSEPGRGTTFRILLPCARQTAAPLQLVKIPSPDTTCSEDQNVLIVEDEELLRLAVAKMLRSSGLSVIQAGDGTQAIDRIREHGQQIGLVLLDITLPGASSRDVLTAARERRPDMKIILTSAYGQKTVDETFHDMGVDAFIRKPYQLADLVTLVRKLVSEPIASARVSTC